MSEQLFDVVFQGQLLNDCDPVDVKNNLASLFNMPEESAEKLLATSHRVLKKGLDKSRALYYQRKLASIGVVVAIDACVAEPFADLILEPLEEDGADSGSFSVNTEASDSSATVHATKVMEPAGDQSSKTEAQRESLRAQAQAQMGDTVQATAVLSVLKEEPPVSAEAVPLESKPLESTPSESPPSESKSSENKSSEIHAVDAEQPSLVSLSLVDRDESATIGPTIYSAMEDQHHIKRQKFSFDGSGLQFFKIWSVNVLLTVVTLGIYSAWAKVRTQKYFYANTRVDNSGFEYLANPMGLLKGRIVLLLLFAPCGAYGAYAWPDNFDPTVLGFIGLVILALLPWLVQRHLIFRTRNSAYRDIRFGFKGGLWGAVLAYALMLALLPLSLGLLLPVVVFMQTKYFVDNAQYGVDDFTFNMPLGTYYRIILISLLGLAVVLAASWGIASIDRLFGVVSLVVGVVLVFTYWRVYTRNLLFNSTNLGDHQFSSSLEFGTSFYLYLVNTVAIVLTAGLFYPWAKVRVARYRAEKLLLLSRGNLRQYAAAQQVDIDALNEKKPVFDPDIGF